MKPMQPAANSVCRRACVPGVKPGMPAVALLLVTMMGDPPPLGVAVNVYLVYVSPG